MRDKSKGLGGEGCQEHDNATLRCREQYSADALEILRLKEFARKGLVIYSNEPLFELWLGNPLLNQGRSHVNYGFLSIMQLSKPKHVQSLFEGNSLASEIFQKSNLIYPFHRSAN